MTDWISDGYLWISNGTDYLKVFCEHIYWTEVYNPVIEHVEGGFNLAFDLDLYYIIIQVSGVWLDSNTKKNNFSTYIKTWQQSNTLQVEVIRNNSDDKEKLDGTNTIFPCHVVGGLKKFEKMPGEQQKYRCEGITFEQSGVAS